MISPEVDKALLDEVFKLYTKAEAIMLEKVAKRVAKDVTSEGWTEKKYGDVVRLKQDLEVTMKELNKLSKEKLEQATVKAYQLGYNSANIDLGVAKVLLNDIHIPLSVQRLILELNNKVVFSHLTILRRTVDAYRNIVGEVSTGVISGVETRLKASQEALNRFADMGITSFVDKSGRRWEMATYAEMSVRTTTGLAAIQGHIDRQVEIGRDLVVISDHSGECPLCRPWEGKILSIRGNDHKYPPLSQARAAGLFHPNCRHTMTGYIPGLTKIEKKEESPEKYELTQQQRYNERQIRKWKRRESVAITEDEKQKAKAKVKMWQAEQRTLLEDTDLRRKYNREGLGAR